MCIYIYFSIRVGCLMSFPGWWPFPRPSSVAAFLTTSSVKVGELSNKYQNDFDEWIGCMTKCCVHLHRLWYRLSEEVHAGTIPHGPLLVCLFLVCSDLGLSSTQCTNVLSAPRLDCLHSFPLSVFLHGCVQCVYPSSVWKHHLLLGCSICICHHGPHHLQSQVSTPSFVITLFVSCPGIDFPRGILSR